MERDNEIRPDLEQGLGIERKSFKRIEGRSLPKTAKLGRPYLLQAHEVEPNLFTELMKSEEPNEEDVKLTMEPISGVSEVDLAFFTMAIQQKIYNVSYLYGNADNTGVSIIKNQRLSQQLGEPVYSGELYLTLNELCELMGMPNPQNTERQDVIKLLEAIDKRKVIATFRKNGKNVKYRGKISSFLEEITIDEETKSTTLHLWVNPILIYGATNNFAEIRQDTIPVFVKSLKDNGLRKSVPAANLFRLLICQDRRKPFVVSIENLLQNIGLWKAYKVTKKRTLGKLSKLFKVMEDTGIITGEPQQTTMGDGSLGLIFTLNPDYIRPQKKDKSLLPDDAGTGKKRSRRRTKKR